MTGIVNDGIKYFIVTLAHVLSFIAVEYYVGSNVILYPWLFGAIGLVLFVSAHTKLRDKKVLSVTFSLVGAVLLFLSLKFYIITHLVQYIWTFIFISLFIVLAKDEINSFIT